MWMLLTFNNILATYYASRPNNSIGQTYVNLSMILSIFEEHGLNMATGGKKSLTMFAYVIQRMYRPQYYWYFSFKLPHILALLPLFLTLLLLLILTHLIYPCIIVDSSLWNFVKRLFLAWHIAVSSCLIFWHFCPTFWPSPCCLFWHTSYVHV